MLKMKSLMGAASVILALSAGPTARADYSSTVNSFGPVGYWPLNETNAPPSNVATNLGTLGATGNGAYGGGITNGIAGALVGSSDTAASFSGTGGLTVPYNAALTINKPFTAEFWGNPSVAPAGLTAVLSCGQFNNPRSGWLIYQDAGGYNFRMYNHNNGDTAFNMEARACSDRGNLVPCGSRL